MIRFWAVVNKELLCYAQCIMQFEEDEEKQRKKRRWWGRDWLLRRSIHGQYDALMAELQLEDPEAFVNFLRLDIATFHELLASVEDRLTKNRTRWRDPVSPGLKLAVTLRFLATGDSHHSLMYNVRLAHNTISGMIVSVCNAILDVMEAEVMKTPIEPQDWLQVAERFQGRWQFPPVLGALGGKHIAIQKPSNSGSTYYNYEGFCSIVLIGLVDADYNSDGFRLVMLGLASTAKYGTTVPSTNQYNREPLSFDIPYYIIADDAFAMQSWLMKLFPHRALAHDELVFNYRLSRARRVVENAFGILANRFRCLLRTLQVQVDTASLIVRTCVVLHNYLRERNPSNDVMTLDKEDANHNLYDPIVLTLIFIP
ncbi:putative nuclease HARBI1 [Haliotis rufescens]|uniref:putative nuclease HARBI1 n=1 Tax=Haliotis rufescens TaxID=6454 RepID=UPI00201EC617|nr:putative nuclease HARBI1 [Haliotis rufescens]